MARWLRRFHLVMLAFWPLFAIPTFLWWRDSIWLVLALSLYANWIGEFAAYQGARAETEDGE